MQQMNAPSLQAKWDQAKNMVRQLGQVIIAFSGGVDSTLVLKLAHDVLGDRVLAITAVSASLPETEREACVRLAGLIGARHRLVPTDEVENPDYAANTPSRCYFCKDTLYTALHQLAADEGVVHILNGTNVDDLGDFRPGLKAADRHHVRSPLKEAGLGKEEVRVLARTLGLPNWNKPAMACLSSRVPYGIPVDARVLKQVEAAEMVLRELGFRQFRVRHHKQLARIEIPPTDFPRALDCQRILVERLNALGYAYVTLDLKGFRSGSLNETLNDSMPA